MQNLGNHQMNPTDTTDGGYEGSDMYTYIHNTVLPILKKSGLNIVACDLVSYDEYEDILSDTGIPRIDPRTDIGDNSDEFWTTSPWSYYGFYGVCSNGSVINSKKGASNYKGVRPLITVMMTPKYNAFFGEAPVDTVGTIGTIVDGTYNVPWVIYSVSNNTYGNTYQLFPMKNLTNHKMNSYDTNDGGYEDSKMYIFIHDTILPNLRKSGLNITACDLISYSVYQDIWSKTGKTSKEIACGEEFLLADPYDDESFYYIYSDGSVHFSAAYSIGVRPLITVVK